MLVKMGTRIDARVGIGQGDVGDDGNKDRSEVFQLEQQDGWQFIAGHFNVLR